MLAVACAAAITVGILTAATSPLVPAAAIAAVVLIGAIWARPILGIAFFVAIVAIVPFGVIPIPLAGAQLTFVDAILIATFSAVIGRVAFNRWHLPVGPAGQALVAFVLIAGPAFVAGGVSTPRPPQLIPPFAKLLASLLFFLI